ncbi:hypothetical protein ACFQS2_04700 [Brachybacterium sp. GCM10030267]|uniref:hypothetical protein n=1 Tax=Brachybacterium sp. GCM10030267 TaxID=3273381 RepID=UPI003611B674
MTLQIVRFRPHAHRLADIESALHELFVALAAAAPDGVEYTAIRVGEPPEILLLLDLRDAAENPLTSLPESLAVRERIADWAGRPVPPQPATVLGHYEA